MANALHEHTVQGEQAVRFGDSETDQLKQFLEVPQQPRISY